VDLLDIEWTDGTPITGTTTFESTLNDQPDRTFTRTVTSHVFYPDFSASALSADRDVAIRGEQLTYTVRLESRTAGGGTVSIHDPLPDGLLYVPDSLEYEAGAGTYDPATHAIRWTGNVRSGQSGYINNTAEYAWGDSNGEQSTPGGNAVAFFDWLDIATTGTLVAQGDEQYPCNLPIGFVFPFYGVDETTFCASTNGFVSFDEEGYANFLNDCPLPSAYTNRGIIAAMWDDLVVEGGLYYQTLGTAPNRHLVVQWSNVRHYLSFDATYSNFQLLLFENGTIKVQIQDVGAETGDSSTTGVANHTNTQGTTYACSTVNSLQDELAVLFVPPGGSVGSARTDVSFAVSVSDALPVNSEITNSAFISSSQGSYTRSVTTALNPISLATSSIELGQDQFNLGDQINVRFVLRNSGLLTATNASFVHTIGDEVTYVPDSLTCARGSCTQTGSTIEWNGEIAPRAAVVIEYSATLTALLPDNTPVIYTAQVHDGYGGTYRLQRSFIARSSDLTGSVVRIYPPFVEPGSRATLEMFIRNTGAVETASTLKWVLSPGLEYSGGTCTNESGTITWAGTMAPRGAVPIRFTVTVPPDTPYGKTFVQQVVLTDGNRNEELTFSNTLTVAHNRHFSILFLPSQGVTLYMPLAPRE
jgi:uncharacterized repeat protein (TIGR01451 family)